MSTTDIAGLLAARALDAVDGPEQRAVEAAVADDPALRAEYEDYLRVAAVLGAALDDGAEAPDHLWERISATLDGDRTAPVIPLRPRRTRFLAALAAAAVLAVAVLGIQVWRQRAEIGELRAAPFAAAVETAREAGAAEIALSGDVAATVVLGADGIGYLLGDTLPALPADLTYQLWAVVDGRVISAGVMGPRPAISPFSVDGEIQVLALTVEVAGGVVVSEQAPVAVATLDS